MPGRPVTDQQVGAYMRDRRRHGQRAAAARAGFSERTARRIEAAPGLPSQRRAERGRTVPDPLAAVWEPLLLPILENDPAVQAVTLLRHLQMTDPDAFPDDRVRRTLERRLRDWRALHGPERDVIFRQAPEPGRRALSDFTDAAQLAITIAGQPLPHRPPIAVSSEHSAAPPTVITMPMRRPSRSTSGPMARAMTAPPKATQVAISDCSTSLQPKWPPISGSNVPKRMKS